MTISAKFYVSVNGGANQDLGIEVPSAATIQLVPGSISGWLRARWEIYDYPPGWTAPVGWLTNPATGTIYSGDITPPAFTLPANAVLWGKWMLRCLVNEQIDDDQNILDEGRLLDDTTALSMLSPNGLSSVGAREKDHFTTPTTRVKGWLFAIQKALAAIEQVALLDIGPTMSNGSTGTLTDVSTLSSGQRARFMVFTGSGAKTINSLDNPTQSRELTIKNAGTGTMTFVHESIAGTAANRINTPNAATLVIASGKSVELRYNTVTSRWDVIGYFSDFGSENVTTTGTATAGAVVAGSFVSAGASPATTGYLRVPTNGNDTLLAARFSGIDYGFLSLSGNVVAFGSTAFATRFQGYGVAVLGATNPVTISGQNVLGETFYSDRIAASLPRHGESTPYASEGHISQGMSDANQTAGSSTYARKMQTPFGALTATRTLTYPHPSSESNSYVKHITNTCTGASLVISTGTGTTVTMYPGESYVLEFRPGGVRKAQVSLSCEPDLFGLRLTASSGNPIPTTDVANATTIYLSPYRSGALALYDGTGWFRRTTSEVSLALSSLSSNTNYDVFANWNGAAVVLSLVAWSGATSRATALATQDGVFVQSGDATKRYVGTIRVTSATQTQDTAAQRFVWNFYNRVDRHLYIEDTTASWTYNSATFRQVRATATNRVETVSGAVLPLNARAFMMQMGLPAGTGVAMVPGIGIDSTTNSAKAIAMMTFVLTSPQWNPAMCELDTVLSAGYHAINWLEVAHASTCTAYGTLGNTQSHLRARAQF